MAGQHTGPVAARLHGSPGTLANSLDTESGDSGRRSAQAQHAPVDEPALGLSRENAAVRELLLALSIGFTLPAPLPRELAVPAEGIHDAVERALDHGLLFPDLTVVPQVRDSILRITPAAVIRSLQAELVDAYEAEGRDLGEAARHLAHSGFRHRLVAAALVRAAGAALGTDPDLAVELYDEALAAGCDEVETASRRAQAKAAIGDLDGAGRIVDGLLVHADPPDVRRGVDVAASVWAERGMLGRSADAYHWLGATRSGPSAPLAAVAMIGCGDRTGAGKFLGDGTHPSSPTLLAVALKQMAHGVLDSLQIHSHQGLPELIRASDIMNSTGAPVPLPDTPAALAALLALHGGEPDVAATVLLSAIAAGQGGPSSRPRLRLLLAWASMQQDEPENAYLALKTAREASVWGLAPRDGFLAAALEVGLARRGGEAHELVRAWTRAREAMLHVSVDLFSLLPWGELMIAAARLRESGRVEHRMSEAWALLERLGNPPLWAVPLHWSAVQAALLNERPADLAPHAAFLVRASHHSHLASALASAGRSWVSVLAGHVQVEEVESAARGLASVGLPWEGSRLAGHAAARADERKDMVRLLACARDIHPHGGHAGTTPAEPAPVHDSAAPASTDDAGSDGTVLSAREREVARMVLEGKTYREIGEAIYISPRTAEHHMARIRRRLGANNRSELLVRLRLALGTDSAPPR